MNIYLIEIDDSFKTGMLLVDQISLVYLSYFS
jgi:hypothetical protein